jgi:hypothetical protein
MEETIMRVMFVSATLGAILLAATAVTAIPTARATTTGPSGSAVLEQWGGYPYPYGGWGSTTWAVDNYPGSGFAAFYGPSSPSAVNYGARYVYGGYPDAYYTWSAPTAYVTGAIYPYNTWGTAYSAGYSGASYWPSAFGQPYDYGSGYYGPQGCVYGAWC